MGKAFKYTSLDRILSKIYRDLGLEEISETDVVEWTGEALEFIGVVSMYEEAIAFIEIIGHQAKFPSGLHNIIQIAKNNNWVKNSSICPSDILLDLDDKNCLPVVSDCQSKKLNICQLPEENTYFNVHTNFYNWSSSTNYKQNYTPVRLSNHTFFNSIVCPEDKNIYTQNCKDEYTVHGGQLRFSFKEGLIALAYHKQKTDPETGYPMIPDDVSIITAITWYITYKYTGRLWIMGREGYADKMQFSEKQWHWYCKQASNNQIMLSGLDQYQNFTEERHELIPRQNKYFGFFGSLGRVENGRFRSR